MTGLELLLTSTTLAASALWLFERYFRRVCEQVAIDPRRDVLWGDS